MSKNVMPKTTDNPIWFRNIVSKKLLSMGFKVLSQTTPWLVFPVNRGRYAAVIPAAFATRGTVTKWIEDVRNFVAVSGLHPTSFVVVLDKPLLITHVASLGVSIGQM